MKKIILTILILLICINGYAEAFHKTHAPQSNHQMITIWDNEYQLSRQIYIYHDNQFQQLASDQEFSLEDFADGKIIYFPNLKINIYTEMDENNNIFGYLEIETEPQTKVEYDLELRVDCLNRFVDLSEPPSLLVFSGNHEFRNGEKVKKLIYDTRTGESSEWLSQLDKDFRLDLKIRLLTKTGSIRSFTVGVPADMSTFPNLE